MKDFFSSEKREGFGNDRRPPKPSTVRDIACNATPGLEVKQTKKTNRVVAPGEKGREL